MNIKNLKTSTDQSFKIMMGALSLALLLNLEGFKDWAQSKEISNLTLLILKTSTAMDQIGQQLGLNGTRHWVRTAFMRAKDSNASVVFVAENEQEMVQSKKQRKLQRFLPPMKIEIASQVQTSETSVASVVPLEIKQASMDSLHGTSHESETIASATHSNPTEDGLENQRGVRSPALFDQQDQHDLEAQPQLASLSAKNPRINTKSAMKKNRVLIIGDSMLKSGLQVHLKNMFKKRWSQVHVEIESQSGTGLSRPEIFNWQERLESKMGHYDYILVILGTNDAQNFTSQGKVFTFGTQAWMQEYGQRVKKLMATSCEKADKVFWVGGTSMRSAKFDDRMKQLHLIAKNAVEQTSENLKEAGLGCAEYMNTYSWLSADEKYSEHLEVTTTNGLSKNLKVRSDDGIHLSFEGAEIFARKLMATVQSRFLNE